MLDAARRLYRTPGCCRRSAPNAAAALGGECVTTGYVRQRTEAAACLTRLSEVSDFETATCRRVGAGARAARAGEEMIEPERQLRDSRQKYNIAHAVYEICTQAIRDARVGGALPSKRLLDNEADAVRELSRARRQLLTAITTVMIH